MTADRRRWFPERRQRAVALLISAAVLALAAGCNRDDSGDNPATPGPSAPPSALAASATPTPDHLQQAEADLRVAQSDYYEAYLAAAAKPKSVSAVKRLLDIYQNGSPGQREIKERMKLLADNGFAARPGPKGYFVVQTVKVASVSDGATAQVKVCTYYDGATYDMKHDGPDGKPITVDDTVDSGETRYRYVNQAGSWKLVGGDVLTAWTGENRCPKK